MKSELHDLVARSVVRPAYEATRWLSPIHRAEQKAFVDGLRFRRAAAEWPDSRKREWILGRLRETVRAAALSSPFYAERFSDAGFDPRRDFDFADFARLPALTRHDIHRTPRDRIVASAAGPVRSVATGGSTGQPVVIYTGPRERGWRQSGAAYFRSLIGVNPGTRTALLWGHHLDPVSSDRLSDRLRDWAANRRWFDCFRVSDTVLEEHHRRLERYRPQCILAYASGVQALAEYVTRQGLRPSYPTKCIITGAEKLYPFQRAAIKAAFRRPVYEQYGTRDVGGIAYQRNDPGSDFDVDWSLVFVEPGDDHSPAPILVTKLQADAMPMIRYELGDLAIFGPPAQPGRPSLVLQEVLGRTVDRVVLSDGSWLHGAHWPHLLKDFPVADFQVYQRADKSVELRLVPLRDLTNADVQAIQRTVEANLSGLPLRIELLSEIPRAAANKWRPVVSDVAPGN